MYEYMAPVLVVWGIFGAVSFIVWVMASTNRRKAQIQAQADMQARLLEKLSASADLAEFLKTEQGQKLLESTSAPPPPKSPPGKILGSIQAGAILTLLGGAFLVLTKMIEGETDGFVVLGVIAGAVGVGFLISSVIAYTLAKSWGLFPGSERRNDRA